MRQRLVSSFRRIGRWEYLGWGLALLLPLAYGAAHESEFPFAYFCWCVFALLSLLGFLGSDFIERRRIAWESSRLKTPKRKKTVKSAGAANYRTWQASGVVLGAMICFVGCSFIRHMQIQHELDALEGYMYPDNIDRVYCGSAKPDDFTVEAGDNAYVTNVFPVTAIAFGCEKVLVIDRAKDGRIGVTLMVRDKEGKVVVDLDKGHFQVNKNNYFRIDRQGSRSVLSVADQYGQELVNLHLLNPNTLDLRALIYYRGEPIRLEKLGSLIGASNVCFEHAEVLVQFGRCLAR